MSCVVPICVVARVLPRRSSQPAMRDAAPTTNEAPPEQHPATSRSVPAPWRALRVHDGATAPQSPTSIASPDERLDARAARRGSSAPRRATPSARSIRPEASPAITGAWVRFVMNPRRSTSPSRRSGTPPSSAAAPAPARSSRRETRRPSRALRLMPRRRLQERVQAALGLAACPPIARRARPRPPAPAACTASSRWRGSAWPSSGCSGMPCVRHVRLAPRRAVIVARGCTFTGPPSVGRRMGTCSRVLP